MIATPVAWVTLIVGIVIGVTMVASSPSPGGSPAALFAMITAIAPAFWALRVLVLNEQVPRSTSATAPAVKPTSGLAAVGERAAAVVDEDDVAGHGAVGDRWAEGGGARGVVAGDAARAGSR